MTIRQMLIMTWVMDFNDWLEMCPAATSLIGWLVNFSKMDFRLLLLLPFVQLYSCKLQSKKTLRHFLLKFSGQVEICFSIKLFQNDLDHDLGVLQPPPGRWNNPLLAQAKDNVAECIRWLNPTKVWSRESGKWSVDPTVPPIAGAAAANKHCGEC